jgi:hypothetical protein
MKINKVNFFVLVTFLLNGCSQLVTETYYSPMNTNLDRVVRRGDWDYPMINFKAGDPDTAIIKKSWGRLEIGSANIMHVSDSFGPALLPVIYLPSEEYKNKESVRIIIKVNLNRTPMEFYISRCLLIMPDGRKIAPISYNHHYMNERNRGIVKPSSEIWKVENQRKDWVHIVYPIDWSEVKSFTINLNGITKEDQFEPIEFKQVKGKVYCPLY